MSKPAVASGLKTAKEFVDFVNHSVTPFHAVAAVTEILLAHGFERLSETSVWPQLNKGGKYFVTRNGSSIVAFAVGGKFDSTKGFKIVGGHTDSPNFQLKPKSHVVRGGYHGVAVQCYGGGLWHTWFDRELTVAGRVVLQRPGKDGLTTALVHIKKPIMRIPSLAIHLRSQEERDSFAPNKERHLLPLIATEIANSEILSGSAVPSTTGATEQSPILMRLIAEQLQCSVSDIIDFDLSVIDTQPATVGGALDEFVFAPRIDNLASCFCGVRALVNANASLADDSRVRMLALFDHEEVGSESTQGAGGTLITDIVERFSTALPAARASAVANSFLLSVDCAHAAHPNYADKHEENHRPTLHNGPVIKYNANTRYATNGLTAATIRAIAKSRNVPVQPFCVKNDSPCGTTIGPILSALSGIAAADIGAPMLSMHSIRETCGTVDLWYLEQLLEGFYAQDEFTHSQDE